ncbi:hypothetical protein C9374_005417 [Naegleria lovaniensis]|uniref:squalene monooxygenase n=1 Tax=Naegleria lovaniensis TaxID=51637 RepID=A0AA88GQH2_NAELO|nr:uncharacterized protein C9374_005417 [Naegleria lovaniensis]KAG2382215.1 hypothetical protein C9374_005417 [Naegleria lovaniensis]
MAPMKPSSSAASKPTTTTTNTTTAPKTNTTSTTATTTTTSTPTTSNQTLLQSLHSTLSKTLDSSIDTISNQFLSKMLGINLPSDQQRKLSLAVGMTGAGLTFYMLKKLINKMMYMFSLPKPSITNKDYDVIIVGAGIAGCALGSVLSKASKKVLVIERDMSEPDRIIGELLQPGGVQHLKDLGLGHCLEGIEAATVKGYQVFYKDETVHMPYPQSAEGRAFHYGRFIMNLRRACEKDGAKMIQRVVTGLIEKTPGLVEGVEYKEGDQTVAVTGHMVIVCNGAGSSFTRQIRSDKIGSGNKPLVVSQFIGLELPNCADKLPNPGHGNVFLLPDAPCLLYPNSTTSVRCLVDFPDGDSSKLPKRGDEMAKYLLQYIMPQLPPQVHDTFKAEVDADRIKVVQNREIPGETADTLLKKGVVLIGDAMNCRHPLTGGGMTVTFSDCKELSKAIINVKDMSSVAEVDNAIATFYKNRAKVANTINILANALYSIFAPPGGAKNWESFKRNESTPSLSENDSMSIMRRAVFEYFKKGGICQTGPLSLISGIWRSPHGLITHFFAVAVIGSFDLIKEGGVFGIFGALAKSFKMITGATGLIAPLIAEEGLLPFLFPRFIWRRKPSPNHQK